MSVSALLEKKTESTKYYFFIQCGVIT